MSLDRRRLQEQIHELYRSEHEALGERGTLERLERGREWDLAPTLAAPEASSSSRTQACSTAGIRSRPRCTAVSRAVTPSGYPGIEELASLAEDAVIVSTADPFHHGIGYCDPPERALAPDDGGLELARATIEQGIDLLGRGTTPATTRTAWGPRATRAMPESCSAILDMTYTDASELYDAPPPTWVAAPLVSGNPLSS